MFVVFLPAFADTSLRGGQQTDQFKVIKPLVLQG